MINWSFDEIEKKINHFALSTEIFKTQDETVIRTSIFEHLKRFLPDICCIDFNCKQFSLKFHYKNDYLNFKPYDLGEIELIFSLNTREVVEQNHFNKTKTIYYLASAKPVSFVAYKINSFIPSFEISFDKEGRTILSGNPIHHENPFVHNIKGDCVSAIIKGVKKTYPKTLYHTIFETYDIEQPFFEQKKNDRVEQK